MSDDLTPQEHALMVLRVNLYGAAQILKGEHLERLKELVREIAVVLEIKNG